VVVAAKGPTLDYNTYMYEVRHVMKHELTVQATSAAVVGPSAL
jgi:hypothetical protein